MNSFENSFNKPFTIGFRSRLDDRVINFLRLNFLDVHLMFSIVFDVLIKILRAYQASDAINMNLSNQSCEIYFKS